MASVAFRQLHLSLSVAQLYQDSSKLKASAKQLLACR